MYNKKALSKATAELDKAKAPKKPKDIITDPMGQWKYPGLPTRIPGNDITMKGVGYPVLGVSNNGQRKIMLPGADYTFPGADYVDEYPQMKKGGAKKKRKTKSIMGINKVMQKGPLFQDYSKKIYDPNVDYFQDGGIKTVKSKDGTVTNTLINDKGDKVMQVKTKDGKYHEKIIPATGPNIDALTGKPLDPRFSIDGKNVTIPTDYRQPDGIKEDIGELFDPTGITSWDDVRRAYDNSGGLFTKETGLEVLGALPLIGKVGKSGKILAGGEKLFLDAVKYLGYNDNIAKAYKAYIKMGGKNLDKVLGLSTKGLTKISPKLDPNKWESSMKLINGLNKFTEAAKATKLLPYMPSGDEQKNNFQDGGEYIEADLTDDEIEEYRKGGFIVEDISVPELNQAQKGKTVKNKVLEISDPEEFAYRKKRYADSLAVYNHGMKEKQLFENRIVNKHNLSKYLTVYTGKNYTKTLGDYTYHTQPDGSVVKFHQRGIDPIKDVHLLHLPKGKEMAILKDLSKTSNGYSVYKKPTQPVVFKKAEPKKEESIIKTPTTKVAKVESKPVTSYPVGYQPYSLYGKVLDPEVYGYAESLNDRPVQVAQFADTYGHKAKMDAYRKSGKYPWKKMGGLVEAQKGGSNTTVHTDKNGTKTTKYRDSNNVIHYKVKTKDGKVYNKQDKSLSVGQAANDTRTPTERAIEMQNFYKAHPGLQQDYLKPGTAAYIEAHDGPMQSVDEFWTLPIGMTSAGVKGAVGLAKGLTSLGRNAVKSSLVQSGKAGTKALLNKSLVKSLPGSSINNLVASGFAGNALTDIVTGKVAEPWKKANKSGKGSDYVDAVAENMYTALDAIPLYNAAGKGLKQLGKYVTTKTPLKNAYKALPQASASKNKIPGLPRVANFVNGLSYGLDDIIKGRKFSEAFPITKKQKAKIEYLQDQAHKEGLEFMDDYLYRIYDGVPHYGEIHPDVRSKIDKITDLEDPTLDAFKRKFDNTHNLIGPYGNTQHHLVNSNEKQLAEALANGNLNDETIDYIRRNKHKIRGVNWNPKSITLRNHGVYYESPETIRNVTVHEAAHSMQELGYGDHTIRNYLSTYNPKYKYTIPNENTKVGKEFRNAQVFPKENQYLWEASPLEVHSEAMTAKDKIYREFVKKGMSKMDALRYLRNPDNTLADEIIKEGSLNRFFKHGITNDQKRKLIKMLPAIIPAGAAVNYMPKPQKSKQMKEGGIVADLTPVEIQDYIKQGYIVEDVE